MIKVPRSVFTREFKEEAVKMVIDGGLSQPEVCRRLSISGSTLAHWVVQARKGGPATSRKQNLVTEGVQPVNNEGESSVANKSSGKSQNQVRMGLDSRCPTSGTKGLDTDDCLPSALNPPRMC